MHVWQADVKSVELQVHEAQKKHVIGVSSSEGGPGGAHKARSLIHRRCVAVICHSLRARSTLRHRAGQKGKVVQSIEKDSGAVITLDDCTVRIVGIESAVEGTCFACCPCERPAQVPRLAFIQPIYCFSPSLAQLHT